MPLYEYYCEPCDGVFELLRPTRDASRDQPCPQCDEDAKRIVSKQWSAFIFRDGAARRLPDTGGYWHLGKHVSEPMRGTVKSGYTHKELDDSPPERGYTLEELERLEYREQMEVQAMRERADAPINPRRNYDRAKARERMVTTRSTDRAEQFKKRFSAREHEATRKMLHKMEKGENPIS